MYENIEADQQIKLHIDVDYKTNETNISMLNVKFKELIDKITEMMEKELLKYGIKNPSIMVLRSNQEVIRDKPSKISGHLIYTNVIFLK